MSSYKLIFCDLDGTLLLPDLVSLSPENLDALKKLSKMGIYVIPCSGRAYGQIPKVLTECPYIKYIATSNGTVIYDRESGEAVIDKRLSDEHRNLLIDILEEYELFPCFQMGGLTYCDEDFCSKEGYASHGVDKYFAKFFDTFATKVKSLNDRARDNCKLEMACAFFSDLDKLRELRARLDAMGIYRTAQSQSHNVEVFPINAGKGNAVRALAEKLGVDIADTIAVGDSNNDATMISAAGLGLAVDNAIPELKEIADAVICNFKDHALKYILEHYICK